MKYYDMNIDTWISVASAAGLSVMLAVWHGGHLSQFLWQVLMPPCIIYVIEQWI